MTNCFDDRQNSWLLQILVLDFEFHEKCLRIGFVVVGFGASLVEF